MRGMMSGTCRHQCCGLAGRLELQHERLPSGFWEQRTGGMAQIQETRKEYNLFMETLLDRS
jgi:hypothetical protein